MSLGARVGLALAVVAGLAVPASGSVGSVGSDDADPADPGARPAADGVVLVGVGGLQWTDVDRSVTPTLWRMLSQGAVGSISVRTAERETCRVDGWLTISAARRILADDDGGDPAPTDAGAFVGAVRGLLDSFGDGLEDDAAVIALSVPR